MISSNDFERFANALLPFSVPKPGSAQIPTLSSQHSAASSLAMRLPELPDPSLMVFVISSHILTHYFQF